MSSPTKGRGSPTKGGSPKKKAGQETLAERLRGRETDDEAVIQQRLDGAQEEMSHYGEFDYLVVNDDFQRALYELEAIVEARRLITARQSARLATTLSNLLAKR